MVRADFIIGSMNEKKRWLVLVLYAVAMAWVESAAVLYLRIINGKIQPYQAAPLQGLTSPFALGPTEMIREAATLVMLVTVGWLAGRNSRARFGYFMIAFGIWDIFYYVFLRVMAGWPATLVDWDVLFLLPLPWWGPVLAPMLISLLLVTGGTLLVFLNRDRYARMPTPAAGLVCVGGVFLSLYVFMQDALQNLSGGREAVANTLPSYFNWPLFCLALLLLAAPIFDLIRKVWKLRGPIV